MQPHYSGVKNLFSSQIRHVIHCYSEGKITEAQSAINKLWLQVDSDPVYKNPNLRKILEVLEVRIKRHFKQKVELPNPAFNNDYYFELQKGYEKIPENFKIKKAFGNPGYKINIVKGSRVVIYWGGKTKQILGRDKTGIDINTYDSVSFGRRKISLMENIPNTQNIYLVTPTYNSAKYIDRTILSVISQEGSFKIHYHIQDGGSTDETLNKLEKWKSILSDSDNPFKSCPELSFSYKSEKDIGMYDAINKGFKVLSPNVDGICSWINSDDILTSGALAAVVNIFNNNKDTFWVIGATCGCDKNLTELSNLSLFFPQEIIQLGLCDGINWRYIQQEGVFWRHCLWKVAKGLDGNLKLCGDWDLWRRFAAITTPIHVEWPLGKFRIHQNQMTASLKKYHDEINLILSTEARQENINSLQNSCLKEIRFIKRPLQSDAVLIFEKSLLNYDRIGKVNNHSANRIIDKLIRNAEQPPLKVLTICTLAHGGAGIGSIRRIKALRKNGIDARLLSLVSNRSEKYIGRLEPALDALKSDDQQKIWQYLLANIQNQVMGKTSFKGHELFSLTETVIDMDQLKPIIDDVDVIHLHWVVGMLDYYNMPKIIDKKPVFWTTADMNSFTGGCHYSEGCMEFMRECEDCPMLPNSNLPHEAWKLKQKSYEAIDITVICPSLYIANIVKRSSLLGSRHIEVIPNAYPVNRIKPIEQARARTELNLPKQKFLLLFGAQDINNVRKGGDLLDKIVMRLKTHPCYQSIEFVFFGSGEFRFPVKSHCLGSVKDSLLPFAYSAVDLFVSLSREDVGPMTVVESMLCGTPVLGFPVGVIPEIVEHESTGYCAQPFEIGDLIKGIEWAIDMKNNSELRNRCRQSAVKYADPKVSAQSHIKLFQSKMSKNINH